jgi:hypothetical protein
MDIIRETSHYATQFEHNTLKIQAERQLSFANIWLNFVRKKKSTINTLKYPTTLPMWLIPGIHFLRYICLLEFTNHIQDEIFNKFYDNMRRTIDYLNNPNNAQKQLHTKKTRPKLSQSSSATKHGYNKLKKKNVNLTRIEKLERMDKKIDRKRNQERLIGKLIPFDERSNETSSISKIMQQDLAHLKIRKFHKLNLLSRGQFATSEFINSEKTSFTTNLSK